MLLFSMVESIPTKHLNYCIVVQEVAVEFLYYPKKLNFILS